MRTVGLKADAQVARPAQTLAILVPYRARAAHLRLFVPHMEQFLARVSLPFRIVVVEQVAGKPFNRAKLLNVGFALASDTFDFFCLHDVDMLPEGAAADYCWPSGPTHLAAEVSQYGYRLPYPTYFGGVALFSGDHFRQVNGCSNEYWGWGLEDNDLFLRCRLAGLDVYRRTGRYRSLWHEPNVAMIDSRRISRETARNRRRWLRFLRGETDYLRDGLNSLQFVVRERRTIFGRHEMVTVEI